MHSNQELALAIINRRDDTGGDNAAYEDQALNPGLNSWGNDPMSDPRVPFPLIMLLVGMFVIAGVGLGTQNRRNRQAR